MKATLRFFLPAMVVALTMSAAARADNGFNAQPGNVPSCNQVAPEVDPSMAVVGVSLLAGSLTVLRSRRRR